MMKKTRSEKSRDTVPLNVTGRWVAKLVGKWVAKLLGRWVAELVGR
jgi:hypothetical protein